MRALLAVLALAATIPVVAGAAAPTPGGLAYEPSTQLAKLSERTAVRVSPDGRRLYFLGGLDDRTSLFVVQRDPRTGRLSRAPGRDECVITWAAGPSRCRTSPALKDSFALAVAPDGRSVVVGGDSRLPQLAVLKPTPGGGLTLASCFGVRDGGFPCAPARRLGNTAALEFSPDGRTLYAGVTEGQGVLVFARNPATGALRQLPGKAGCLVPRGESTVQTSCSVVPVTYFRPRAIHVLPFGRTVLVVSDAAKDDGLFVFRRNPATGALTFLSCSTSLAEPPCTPSVAPQAKDVVVRTDARTLYAIGGGPRNARLDVLRLDPGTGELTRAACYTNPASRCAELALPYGAQSAAFAPDGRTLYIGGFFALRGFRVGGTRLEPLPGELACNPSSAACASGPRPSRFDGYRSLAMTPDGRGLYVAGYAALAFRIAPSP